MGFLISSAESEQRVDVIPPPLQVEIIEAVQSEGVVKSTLRELYSPVIKSTWSSSSRKGGLCCQRITILVVVLKKVM